jgi:uncharacterized metal-binding protein YceD (DUF177 family)
MEEKFIIPLNGLASGANKFSWDAGAEFFRNFDNTEIIDADFTVDTHVMKNGREISAECQIDGTVTVLCDRCMEDLVIPFSTDIELEVKYGEEEYTEPKEDEEIEEKDQVYVPDGETDLNLNQIIYDYICLSLPMQRFHEDGECNSEVLKRLEEGVSTVQEGDEEQDTNANPFATLQGLFK